MWNQYIENSVVDCCVMFYVWCCMLCCRCFNRSVSSFFVAASKTKCDLPMQASKEKEVELKTVWDLRCTAKIVRNRWRNWTTTLTPIEQISESLAVFAEVLLSPSCSMIFQNLTLHVENAFEFLRTRCLRNSFRQQKLRRRMSWPPRRSIWKMRKRPLAGKHYETAWKLGFEILEWPTFSESLLGWARLL